MYHITITIIIFVYRFTLFSFFFSTLFFLLIFLSLLFIFVFILLLPSFLMICKCIYYVCTKLKNVNAVETMGSGVVSNEVQVRSWNLY